MIVFFPYKKCIRSISLCNTGTGFAVIFSLRDKKVRPQRNAAVAVSEENKRGNLYLSSDVLSSEDFLYGGCHFVGSFLFLRFRKIEMAAGVAGDHFRSLLSNFCSHPSGFVRARPGRPGPRHASEEWAAGPSRPCASSAPVQPTPSVRRPARFPPVRRFFRRHNPTPAAPAAFARPPGCSRRSGVKFRRPGSRGLLRVFLRPARPTRPSPGLSCRPSLAPRFAVAGGVVGLFPALERRAGAPS